MSYTIANTKDDLAGILHSTDLSKIQNINQLFDRAGRQVLAVLDPRETIRIGNLTTPIHDQVYDYALQSDVKRLIDVRPQANRKVSDTVRQYLIREFDRNKDNADGLINIKHDDGVKSIRIAIDVDSKQAVINNMDSLTNNGTWAVGGDATDLSVDTQYKISGSGSLNFSLTGSTTTAHIENSTMDQVDLSTHDEVGSFFVWVYFPDASLFSNVQLRWGNDTSNYWTATATGQQDSTSFRNGWNLLRFDWNGATETGTVDPSTIDYLRVTTTVGTATAETDIRVDNIISSIGYIFEDVYYSKYMFRTSSGTWTENTTNDSDIVNLDTEAYNIFLFQVAEYASQQELGSTGQYDNSFFHRELYGDGRNETGLYQRYKDKYPSEYLKPQATYYNFTRFGSRRTKKQN